MRIEQDLLKFDLAQNFKGVWGELNEKDNQINMEKRFSFCIYFG